MRTPLVALVAVLGALAAACGGAPAKAPPGQSLVGRATAPAKSATGNGAAEAKADLGVLTPSLHVSSEIARLCGMTESHAEPHFDFDRAELVQSDRDALAVVARCLTTGALRGRSVTLVGRTDPRGEDEYNMGLGEARADAVRRYMHDLGVGREQLVSSSRGELDAVGTDENTWALDRRVDIELVPN